MKEYSRNSRGEFSSGVWRKVKIAFCVSMTVAFFVAMAVEYAFIEPNTVSATNEHSVIEMGLMGKRVNEMKEELADFVCGKESAGIKVKSGDIFGTFDPSRAMAKRCSAVGGVQPIDCMSYGICQEKVGTIQHYAPQVYGHSVTQKEAFGIATDDKQARKFFVDCSIKVEGCVWNWSKAKEHPEYVRAKVEDIRKFEKPLGI